MPITYDELNNLLQGSFPDAEIELEDLAGDNDHWQATIISPQFKGKTRLEQHRLVQDAVKDQNIHALSIKTRGEK
jgi:stress-induced morphogen